MDYKYIEQLLERYWQGMTTLEEERILRAFFSQ
ncbi:MAG: pyruvate ferredoxin oxidoreductase, partial [Prevotella sp.]|nr:pyruvate ferredoxin oxidoreductase [Prevotella sp.]